MPKITDASILQIANGQDPNNVYAVLADANENPSITRKTSLRKLEDVTTQVHDLGTTSGALTVNFEAGVGKNKKVELNGNVTLTFTGGRPGVTYVLSIKTNGNTVTWPSNLAFFDGAPTFSNGALFQPVQLYFQS